MLKLSNGRVFLMEGEPIPVMCKGCWHAYPPDEGDGKESVCPRCGNVNDLSTQEMVEVPMKNMD